MGDTAVLEPDLSHSHLSLSRRAFAQGIFGASTAVLGLALTGRAIAAPADPNAVQGNQAEWAQKYEGDAKLGVQRSTTPILSLQTLSATENAIRQYQEIAAQGGWPRLPPAWSTPCNRRMRSSGLTSLAN